MTLAELSRWSQDGLARIALAWSRTFELLLEGRLGQLRVGDLVIIWLTCMALGWLIDTSLRDPAPAKKESRRD